MENGGCRHQKILTHLSEEIGPCDVSCDWCTGVKAEELAAAGMMAAGAGMHTDAARPSRRSRRSPDRVAEPGPLSEQGEALFQSLRELRKSLADRQGVPAYIVFSDKTLRAMAETRPSTPGEFLAVSGVRPLKLERYGEAFLQALRETPTSTVTINAEE